MHTLRNVALPDCGEVIKIMNVKKNANRFLKVKTIDFMCEHAKCGESWIFFDDYVRLTNTWRIPTGPRCSARQASLVPPLSPPSSTVVASLYAVKWPLLLLLPLLPLLRRPSLLLPLPRLSPRLRLLHLRTRSSFSTSGRFFNCNILMIRILIIQFYMCGFDPF